MGHVAVLKKSKSSTPRRAGIRQIERWLTSPRVATRLHAMSIMRQQFKNGKPRAYLRIAEGFLSDRSGNVRWQAAILIGMSIDSDPDEVWRVLCENDHRRNQDATWMFGCVLLEDLLWAHFDVYWPRVVRHLRNRESAMRPWLDMVGRTPLKPAQQRKVARVTHSRLFRHRSRAIHS